MANNDYVNKVQYGNDTLIDLTNDTVSANQVMEGYTFHAASGEPSTGSLITHAVYNGLDSSSTEMALSANQGKALKTLINENAVNIVVNTTFLNITIPDGTLTGYSQVELDCSSIIPAGYELYGATLAVLSSNGSWYTLPWFNNALTQILRISHLIGKKIYLRNASTGWGTTRISASLFLKKTTA